MVQYFLRSVVGKADILNLHSTPNMFHRHSIRRVGNSGLGAHQLDKPVQSGKSVGEQLGKVGQLTHRCDERGDIQAEGDQIHIVHAFAHDEPAASGDHRHVQQRHEQLHGGVEPPHLLMKPPLGGLEGLVGTVEPLLLDGLVAKGLDGADAAEAGFDLGVDGAGFLLGGNGSTAHTASQQHQHRQKHRNDGHHDQCHAPFDGEHHRQRAHDGDDGDGQVLRSVMGQLRQFKKIGGQPAHQLPCAVAVIKVEAQHLHMVEQVSPDVRLHPDAESVPPVGHNVVQYRPQHKGQRHDCHHHKEHAVVFLRQPLIQRSPGYQRERQIHQRNEDRAAHVQ